MASIQATRLKKGHAREGGRGPVPRPRTPARHTRATCADSSGSKFRNIRNGPLSDQKLRSEDSVERAMLDERADAVSLQGRRLVPFHGHGRATSRSTSTSRCSGDYGELPHPRVDDQGRGSTDREPVGIELPLTVDLKVEDTAPGIKGATASAQVKPATSRDRPRGAGCRRSVNTGRHGPGQYRETGEYSR